jgi:TPR repeat protein
MNVTEETAAHLVENENYEEAFEQYFVLAGRQSTTAQLRLAWMYETGKGIAQNFGEAEKWYRIAAETGNPYAQFNLGNFYRRVDRYGEAADWLERSDDQGYLPATYALGILYRFGAGVPQDAAKALGYFERAAHGGHVFGMREIAVARIRGQYGPSQITSGIFPVPERDLAGCQNRGQAA